MARGQNPKMKDNNESRMAQVPKYDTRQRGGGEETEFAQELGDRYELEQKPGFQVTGVRRKNQ